MKVEKLISGVHCSKTYNEIFKLIAFHDSPQHKCFNRKSFLVKNVISCSRFVSLVINVGCYFEKKKLMQRRS